MGFLRRYGAWKRKHFLNTPSRRKKVTGIKVMRGVGCEWLETMSWGRDGGTVRERGLSGIQTGWHS